MDIQKKKLLNRLENCDLSDLSLVHQDIYTLPEEQLRSISLDLIPILFSNLLRDSCLTSLQTLEYVAAISNPKEAVIALLEISCYIENNFNLIVFLIQLKLLALSANSVSDKMQYYCIDIQNKRFLELVSQWSEDCDLGENKSNSYREEIEWLLSLNTVFEIDFNSQSLKIINSNQTTRFRVNCLFVSISLFLSSLRTLQTSLQFTHREFPTLVIFNLWLLGLYTSLLDLTSQDFCYQFLFSKLISTIKPVFLITNSVSLFTLFATVQSGFEGEEHDSFNKLVRLGVAHFIYLAVHEGLIIDPLPICYSPIYLQESLFPITCVFLSFSAVHLTSRGLKMLERVTTMKIMFGVHCEWQTYAELCYSLTQVMVYSDEENNRKTAVNIFKRLFSLFPPPLLHWLYKYLLYKVSHAGVTGFIITILKDDIHKSLLDSISEEYRSYFTGSLLHSLLKRIVKIPTTQPAQLANEIDSILSTINLLRYLLLRDSEQTNNTQVWNLLTRIQNYTSNLNNLATEAIVLCHKDLDISAKQTPKTNNSQKQIDESTQYTISKLYLIIDLNNRLSEIITESK
ncbi:Glomulin [Oopsacas minuta]|uniref:Glomulin n=1 Tax=Oopsacas minuta TaxID=111878 RepID=A0AAV7JUM5_9METZ|nr:Glomulin [Oopsacas minuta]